MSKRVLAVLYRTYDNDNNDNNDGMSTMQSSTCHMTLCYW